MKIGIITFWQSYDNYGQLLQCWALQQVLLKMGHAPFLIRYNYHNYFDDAPLWKKIARMILVKPFLKQVKKRQQISQYRINNICREFDKFREEYLIKSDFYYASPEELINNPPQADAYITGSDQVWAQLAGLKRSMPFFLDFGSFITKRISYAPSFAMKTYPEKNNKELMKALEKFYAISVREQDGVDICRKLGYDAVRVLDPTLLLNKNLYENLITNKENKSPYTYIYSINIADAEELRWGELKEVCMQKGQKVIVTPGSGYLEGKELFGEDVAYDYASIPQWLSNISQTQMMVTTSFHGIVFSLILHTPMIYVPLKGKYAFGNNRAEELLINVGLADRILNYNTKMEDYYVKTIDWDGVDARLTNMRQSSIDFLNKALS